MNHCRNKASGPGCSLMLQARSLLLLAAALAGGLAHAACTFSTKFWEYRDNAPVRSVQKPPGFTGREFGTLMAPVPVRTAGTELDPGFDGDYLAVAGSSPSEVILLRFSKSDDLVDGELFARVPAPVPADFFDSGFAASIAGAPLWQDGTHLRPGCTIVGVPGRSRIEIFDIGGTSHPHPIPSLAGAGSFVDAVVRDSGAPVDGFVVGGSSGAVFVPASMATEGQPLEVTPPVTPPAAISGVASGSVGAGHEPWLAVGSDGRVFVFLYSPAASRYELEECIESGDPGFGTVVAAGDADGDGVEDLIISSRADIAGRYDRVAVISGARFDGNFTSSPSTCTDPGSMDMEPDLVVELSCTDVEDRDVACGDGSMFGSAVAVGNLDADGPPEIIVGAPGAGVDGTPGAGAALVFQASSAGPVSALRTSAAQEDQHLASSVAVLSIAGRDEVFVGMPTGEKVLLYYCSGAGTDTSPPGDNFCR
jgi:hypothetical protein